MFELIVETSCPGKAPDGVTMFLDETLYPNGDAVTRLSPVELTSFLVTLGLVNRRDSAVASSIPRTTL